MKLPNNNTTGVILANIYLGIHYISDDLENYFR
jgi:hypothetical protein